MDNKELTEEQQLVWDKLSKLPDPLDADLTDGIEAGFFYCPYVPIMKINIQGVITTDVG